MVKCEMRIDCHDIKCGVYMLMFNSEPVYIGQSRNLTERINGHLSGPIKFDDVIAFECDESDLDDVEAKLIVEYKPKLNKSLPFNTRYKRRSAVKNAMQDIIAERVGNLESAFSYKNYDYVDCSSLPDLFSELLSGNSERFIEKLRLSETKVSVKENGEVDFSPLNKKLKMNLS